MILHPVSRLFLAMIAVFSFAAAWGVASPVNVVAQSDVETAAAEVPKKAAKKAGKRKSDGPKWFAMKDNWEECRFGGDGPIEVKGNGMRLGVGDPMTGVRWKKDFPKDNFEIRFEARRVEGLDFFAGVTFPVGKGECSLVMGGWGGGVLGISSIDGEDASNNETTQYYNFKNGQWYKVRIQVVPEKLTCWIDDKVWVEFERGLRNFDVRLEMDPTLPMGIANFQCVSEIRNIEMRSLVKKSKDVKKQADKGKAAPVTKDAAK